uniref:Right handed beta helix domain-containing protein n=1 Tax=Acetithermum autotrophicum TaxID=1446466 RepID=H5SVQ1_ACEAU|nr:hypothetical protein HGMM_OP4C316 [Candidatus Acetothermum autotrophicum]
MLRVVKLFGLGAALVVSVIGLSVESLRSQPYTVCPSGCPFSKIQAALDAAKDGDTITVGPGVYRENLKITKSVSLIGAGAAQTRVMPAHPGIDLILVELGDFNSPKPLEQVRLEGFTFQGPLHSEDGIALIRNWAPLRSLQLRQNIFRDAKPPATGIEIFYSEEFVAEGNSSSGVLTTLDIRGGRQIRVARNRLESVMVDPAWQDEQGQPIESRAEVVDNDVSGGIGVSGNTIVRNNRLRGGSIGVGVGSNHPVDFVQVLNNELIGPGVLRRSPDISWGIHLGDSGDRVLIEGNKITNYDVGIMVSTFYSPPPHVQIRKNVISQGLWGIYFERLWREASRFEIIDNTIDRQKSPDPTRPFAGAAIFVDSQVGQDQDKTEILLQGNTFRLGDYGVLLAPYSGKFEFQGNKITDNDLFGVLLAVPPCGEVTDPAKVQVTGSGNEIANNGKRLPPEVKARGDGEGNVCPKELTALKK